MTDTALLSIIPTIAAYMKTAVGAANNAAWYVCLEAHDHIKQHPAYRQKVKQAYRAAIAQLHRYENRLLHAEVNRLFHVDDLPAEQRARFGDITDRDYYDMWASSGVGPYEQTRPIITSLWNKYRLSLINHNVRHADLLAWPMTAMCTLKLALKFYRSAVDGAHREWGLPLSILETVFGQLSLEAVCKEWEKALNLTDPQFMDYDLDEVEERNIQLGLRQLEEVWSSPDVIIGGVYASVKDWKENFASKAEH